MQILFKKYPSIENFYRSKYIDKALRLYPKLQKETFIITEKIHGTNFAVYISNEGVRYAKRTAFLEPNEDFYGYQEVIEHSYAIKLLTQRVQAYIANSRQDLGFIFYGELFGGKIQKGVDYGKSKKWRVFDIYAVHSKRWLSPEETIKFLEKIWLTDIYVPIIEIVQGLDNALAYDVENLISQINPQKENYAEGVVIKPFRTVYLIGDSPFWIKKKSEKFMEKKKAPKPKKQSPEIEKWQTIIESYITETRLDNLFSKVGEIKSEKEIGKYIKLYIEDVLQDLRKDYPEFKDLPKTVRSRALRYIGSKISKMLIKRL